MDHESELQRIDKLTAAELLRLPLAALDILVRTAAQETQKARRRENWLRNIRAEKIRIKSQPQRGGR